MMVVTTLAREHCTAPRRAQRVAAAPAARLEQPDPAARLEQPGAPDGFGDAATRVSAGLEDVRRRGLH